MYSCPRERGEGGDKLTTYSSANPWSLSGSPVVGSQSLTLNLSVFRNVPVTGYITYTTRAIESNSAVYATQTYGSILHLEEGVGSGGMVVWECGNGNIGQDAPSLALFYLDPYILQQLVVEGVGHVKLDWDSM